MWLYPDWFQKVEFQVAGFAYYHDDFVHEPTGQGQGRLAKGWLSGSNWLATTQLRGIYLKFRKLFGVSKLFQTCMISGYVECTSLSDYVNSQFLKSKNTLCFHQE